MTPLPFPASGEGNMPPRPSPQAGEGNLSAGEGNCQRLPALIKTAATTAPRRRIATPHPVATE
jgi:hypothetical protein